MGRRRARRALPQPAPAPPAEVQELAEILQRLLRVIADYEASVRAEYAAGRLSDEARWAGFDLLRPLQVQVSNALGQLLGPLSH